jgi:hypothetical protein
MTHWMDRGRPALAFAALVLLAPGVGATDRYVATIGSDGTNDCAVATAPCRSITHAIAQTASGDTVNVATGIYREGVRILSSTVLTFLGGWNPQFTQRDPRGAPSVIKSAPTAIPPFSGKDRTWVVFADDGMTIDVTIDGFVLTGGKATVNLPDLPTAGASYRAGGGLTAYSYEDSALALTVRDSVITRNRSLDAGGGVLLYVWEGSSLDATFSGVQVTKNRAGATSGGIYAIVAQFAGGPSTASLRLINSAVVQNMAKFYAGGVSVENVGVDGSSMTFDLIASTVARNQAQGPPVVTPGSNQPGGGGLALLARSPLAINVVNAVVWGNKATGAGVGQDIFELGAPAGPSVLTLDVDHSDIGDVVLNTATLNDLGGNLDVDPGFTRAPRLRPTSPLIDVGTCTGVPAADFEGDVRPLGTTCDIGADEVAP